MTLLYLDTNIGCYDHVDCQWTAADENKSGLIARLRRILF